MFSRRVEGQLQHGKALDYPMGFLLIVDGFYYINSDYINSDFNNCGQYSDLIF